jgi:sirohydrochlorin cobaltochelatase
MTMTSLTAYLFLAHGSRDLRTTTALQQLVQAGQALLSPQARLLGTAYLELADRPITEQIMLFAQQAVHHNCQRIKILPLFLAPGTHVLDDLPIAIQQAQKQLADRCQLELLTYLGAHVDMIQILQQQRQQLPATSIFLAHGSSQIAAQDFLTAVANHLQLAPAYWSGTPQLAEQITQLAAHHPTEIGILPYFLFPGRISTALGQVINELQSLFPDIQFRFTQKELEPSLLGANPQLIDLLVTMFLADN